MNWNKIQLIGIIAVTIFCFVMLGTSSKAEEHFKEMPPGQWDYSQFFVKAVNLYCGTTETKFEGSEKIFGEKPMSTTSVHSYYADGTKGPAIGVMSFWYNVEYNSGTLLMTLFGTPFTCLLGYGRDWVHDENMLLDIVNKQINANPLPTP